MKFNPCTGKCTKEGTHCEGCGRTHEEVAETKQMISDLVGFVQKMDYENPKDFAHFIEHGIMYTLENPHP